MNGHLTEQQLIDYQFKLASDAGMDEARAHLEQCESCRQHLAELGRKFAALDLLREEVKPSDALIARTVENAAKARHGRVIPFLSVPWLGAIAAAIIVGVALLVAPNLGPQGQPKGTLAPTDARRVGLAPPEPAGKDHRQAALDDATRSLQPGGIDEKPPFAPASAIELVVLPRRENVQLTIYNSADLTLVRERRNLILKQGWNWLQFMWANTLIDPTSLTLEPLEHKGEVEVQQLVFPPRLRELGRWLIHSKTSGQVSFELTYFTSGLSWRAFYMGTLSQDEKTMRLEAYVRVNNNSGEDYEDAQTRLIVGQVHLLDEIVELAKQQHAYGNPADLREEQVWTGLDGRRRRVMRDARVYSMMPTKRAEVLAPKVVKKEGLSEYFLYTIEGTETIPNEWGKRLLSMEADGIPVKALYKYDDERWGDQTIQFVSFVNDEKHKLGQTPLPDGTVRIYGRADEQGHLSYVGGADVKYIPVGEEIELDLGAARLVEVKPVLVEERTENYVFDQDGDVSGWDEVRTWKIEVTNTRTLPADIEITRGFETAYWTLKQGDAGASYEKHDVMHARFRLTIEPRSKRIFEYTVTTYHGVREQSAPNSESNKKD